MENKLGPCIEKNCSVCCNPVKVNRFFPEDKIPKNKKGEKLWRQREEILIPKDDIDAVKLDSYDCVNYDKEGGGVQRL
ncbi:MAG: hypothetical protein V1723_01680 [Candidatus Uhrbacteria bacterium]